MISNTLRHKPIAKSLRRKLLLPLAIAGIVLAIGVFFLAQMRFQQLLVEKLAARAELVANTINYAAEGLSRAGELQRIVSSLGAEKEVDLILVVAGTQPEQILGSTKNAFLGKSLDYLNDPEVKNHIQTVLQTKSRVEHLDQNISSYEIALPLLISQSKQLDEKALVNAVVFVQLDSRPTQRDSLLTVAQFSALFLGLFLILIGYSYWLLRCYVIKPIKIITHQISDGQAIQTKKRSEKEYDEISLLGDCLNDAFHQAEHAYDALASQQKDLQASEKRLNEIINLMPVAVFVKDSQSRMTIMNKTCENQWGICLSEIQNTTASHIFPPEQMEIFLAMDKKIFVDGKTLEYQESVWSAELQENRVMHTYKKPVFNERGEPDYLIGISIDVTEDKRKEQELLASEARFRSIIDISPVPLALNDNLQNITFLNNAFTNTFGYDLNDIPTLSQWWEKAYPDENYRQWVLDTWTNTIQECERENKTFPPLEFSICCKDGTQKTVLVSATGISDSFDLHLVMLYDITQRKQVEKALSESEFRWKFAVEGSGDGLWDWDIKNSTVFFSHRWKEMLGFSDDEIGNGLDEWEKRIHPDDKEHAIATVEAYLEGKTSIYINEHRVNCKDGNYKWILDRGMVVDRDEDGKPLRMIGTHTDIDDRKILETELARSNADLEQFAYAVSHDMRQPLRMVTSYLDLIERALEKQLDEDTRQFLNFAIDGAKRMDSMILSLLDYSRLARKNDAFELISSQNAVNEALQFLEPALKSSNGLITVEGDWVEMVANRDEFTRLLQNLIGNALKYHQENQPPLVQILARVSADTFRVEIKDSGIGIAPNQIDRLFKVFSRLQSRSRFEGSGVGLALCRKIVEHHGGEIGVKSEGEGLGSVFWFELPLIKKLNSDA